MSAPFLRRLIALVYPVRCPVCGCILHPEETFCQDCAGKLTRFTGDYSVPGADGCFACFVYDEAVKPAVILMKRGIAGNAPYAFGRELTDLLRREGIAGDIDMIVPVPMHRSDKRRRGYNQAELLARETGKALGIAVCRDAAVKLRKTAEQKSLSRRERMENLKGAFRLSDPERVRGKRVLLMDDVCTTGSTMAELTALLRSAGAERVWCISCCKTPEREEKNDDRSR